MPSNSIDIEDMCRAAPNLFRVGTKQRVTESLAVHFIKTVERPLPEKPKQLSKK